MKTSSAIPAFSDICKAIQKRRDWGISALRELIACDSISPHEQPCQEVLAKWLSAEDLQTRLIPLDESLLRSLEWFSEDGLPCDNRANLVAEYGGTAGRSLILNAHIDTVSWEDQFDRWDFHPLSAELNDGKLYGRGSVDDKGPLIAGAVAILALKDLGFTPPGKVILTSVVAEEPSGNGTLALCAEGVLADGAINLEPTDSQVCFGHRGVIGFRFPFESEALHGSLSVGAKNTIIQAGKFAEAFSTGLDGWKHPQDGAYGAPTVNVGVVKGGTDIFTTPSQCTLGCAVRYAPGTYEQIVSHLDRHLSGENCEASHSIREAIFLHHDASEVPTSSSLAQTFLDCANAASPGTELKAFPAGTDARHLNNRYQVPTIIYGPGELALAHAVNERLCLDEWERSIQALALFITRWCK